MSLCAGLGFSACWGLWLVLAPAAAGRFNKSANQWVPTAAWFDRLNRPLDTTRWFYRYHRVAGALIMAGATYALWRWFSAYDRGAVVGILDRRLVLSGLDWLIPSVEWIFVAFNAAILMFGLVILFRPSLLKTPERWANRWVEVQGDQVLDRKYDPLSIVLSTHPRLFGASVALVCGFLLWRLAPLA